MSVWNISEPNSPTTFPTAGNNKINSTVLKTGLCFVFGFLKKFGVLAGNTLMVDFSPVDPALLLVAERDSAFHIINIFTHARQIIFDGRYSYKYVFNLGCSVRSVVKSADVGIIIRAVEIHGLCFSADGYFVFEGKFIICFDIYRVYFLNYYFNSLQPNFPQL